MTSVKTTTATPAGHTTVGVAPSGANSHPLSSPASAAHATNGGYFGQYLGQQQLALQTHGSGSHGGQPHAHAHTQQPSTRASYHEGVDYLSTQGASRDEDDRTILNTIANSHISQSSVTGGPLTSSSYLYTDTAEPSSYNANGHTDQNRERDRSMIAPTPITPRPGTSASAMHPPTNRAADDWDVGQRGSVVVEGGGSGSNDGGSVQLPARSNTLKKKSSLRKSATLHRTSSRRSMKAGSVRSLALQSHSDLDESHNAFYCPVPTKGNPTEVLANRFQAWRKILKDLIAYHRDIQSHYEQRAKSLQKLSNTLSNTSLPPGFIANGGLDDATQILRNYNKQSIAEAIRAREIEDDVIMALTGLRSDLSQKIKEIKNISGDFRNSVDKEMDATKRAVKSLQDVLGQSEIDSSQSVGRQDPYLLRLAVDRQLERQLQEENYLHQAFLNLEKSGRELESIVVGEIQKSYNAYAGILKREAGTAWDTVEELRGGPVAMPKDQEWVSFIQESEQFVDPDVQVRSLQFIHYPGQDHFACQEIRAGLLERKSKYLKSYTAGWYVLSPTHLHEFKSADKMQAPLMSLYLPEQKLGSHSTETASSSKFVLKGRQTGSMHRGHTWVFRAESYDTMMAWYEDIYGLTEKTPQERTNYARGQHTRSVSRSSQHTYSSDGVVNEDDDEPFAINSPAAVGATTGATAGSAVGAMVASGPGPAVSPNNGSATIGSISAGHQQLQHAQQQLAAVSSANRRPSAGGRFPSDLQVNAERGMHLQAAGAIPVSPVSATGSGSLEDSDYNVVAEANALGGHYSQDRERTEQFGFPRRTSFQIAQMQQQQQQQYPHQQQAYGSVVNNQLDGVTEPYYQSEESVPSSRVVSASNASPVEQQQLSQTGLTTQQPRRKIQQHGEALNYSADGQRPHEPRTVPDGRTPVSVASSAELAMMTPAMVAEDGVSNGKAITASPNDLTRQNSEPVTISNLHIPGDFPRSAGVD